MVWFGLPTYFIVFSLWSSWFNVSQAEHKYRFVFIDFAGNIACSLPAVFWKLLSLGGGVGVGSEKEGGNKQRAQAKSIYAAQIKAEE